MRNKHCQLIEKISKHTKSQNHWKSSLNVYAVFSQNQIHWMTFAEWHFVTTHQIYQNANIHCHITEDIISMRHQQQCPAYRCFLALTVFRYSGSLLGSRLILKTKFRFKSSSQHQWNGLTTEIPCSTYIHNKMFSYLSVLPLSVTSSLSLSVTA